MSKLAHTQNPHDAGWDIATGRDIAAGQVVGHIWWDSSDPSNEGLCLTFRADEDDALTPDSAEEAIALICQRGYELDKDSQDDIRALRGDR